MDFQVVFSDLRTDGIIPVNCNMHVDHAENSKLVLKFDELHLEILIPLYYLGMVLGDEMHG